MIGFLSGSIHAKLPLGVILNVQGVGYKVYTPKDTLARTTIGSPLEVWVHTTVREDALDLYGFESEDELQCFELLLTVSGIGSKSALGILDIATPTTLRTAIAEGNASYLTKVSGIGRKTAEKIILELRDKVGAATIGATPSGDEEALEALKALGYDAQTAREVLRKVPGSVESSSARLKEALKILGSRL